VSKPPVTNEVLLRAVEQVFDLIKSRPDPVVELGKMLDDLEARIDRKFEAHRTEMTRRENRLQSQNSDFERRVMEELTKLRSEFDIFKAENRADKDLARKAAAGG